MCLRPHRSRPIGLRRTQALSTYIRPLPNVCDRAVGDASFCLRQSDGVDQPLVMATCDHTDLRQRFYRDSRDEERIMRGATLCIGFDSCPHSTTTGTMYGSKMLGCVDGTFCNADTLTGGNWNCCWNRGNQRRQCPVRALLPE